MDVAELQDSVRRTVADPTLTYRQRLHRLAGLAEESVPPPPVSDACRDAQRHGVICDLAEGHAPYRPRYLLPDYAALLACGQEQGLMFVRDLPADRGMIFPQSEPRPMSMWMKNTFIPLDMVFIDSTGDILKIAAHTQPHSLATISSDQPVAAVLELRGGEAERRLLKVGDRVSWQKMAPYP